mmetsp:Transcript_30699/g.49970  ORF Transcript_30699/g.49970 Transcript_30699/m.49970 type:complete len:387 (+) Transcript_30699:227-1387(+)
MSELDLLYPKVSSNQGGTKIYGAATETKSFEWKIPHKLITATMRHVISHHIETDDMNEEMPLDVTPRGSVSGSTPNRISASSEMEEDVPASATLHPTKFVGNKQEIDKRSPLLIDSAQNSGSPPPFLSPQSTSARHHEINSTVPSTSHSHHETSSYSLPIISPRRQKVNGAIPLPPETVDTAIVPPPPPARRLVQLNMKLIEGYSMDSAIKDDIGAQAQKPARSQDVREKSKFKETSLQNSNSSSSYTNARPASPVSLVRELSRSFSVAKTSSMMKATKSSLMRKKIVGIKNISSKEHKEATTSAAKSSPKQESKAKSAGLTGNSRRRISATKKASKIEALKHKFSGSVAVPKASRSDIVDNAHEESNKKRAAVRRKKWPPVKTNT